MLRYSPAQKKFCLNISIYTLLAKLNCLSNFFGEINADIAFVQKNKAWKKNHEIFAWKLRQN